MVTTKQAMMDKLKDLEAREVELMRQMNSYRDDNKIEFFTRPNPLQEQLLTAWGDESLKVFTFSGSNRLGKCLTYQTLIDTPNGKVSMGELFEAGEPFDVFSWNGKRQIVTQASAPFKKKGLHRCYKITMSDGQVIEAADHHRVLTSHGWFSVERLQASFDNLQGSSLEHDLSALFLGDLHWSEKGKDFLAHYFAGSRQYDEQPLFSINSGQVFFPSQAGVLQHNALLCNLGALGNIYKNTLRLISGLLSNQYVSPRFLGQYVGSLFYAFCKSLPLEEIYNRSVPQPIFESSPRFQSNGVFFEQANQMQGLPFLVLFRYLCSIAESLKHNKQVAQKSILKSFDQFQPIAGFGQPTKYSYHDNTESYNPPFKVIGNNQIESITPIKTRQEVCYDFEVPKYKNYFAGGIVHHNTTIGTVMAFSTMFGYWPWDKDKLLYFSHDKPRKVRYIGQDWEKQIKTVLIPELEKWWPANRKVIKKKNNQGIDAYWKDELTGSTLELMSNGQESDLHEGWSGDLIIYDEPCKRSIRVANARGLIDRSGRELFCMTLLKEAWISREVINAVDENGRPDKTVFNITGDISNNVGYGITQEGVDQFVKTLSPDEYDARIKGIPSYMSGLVYPAFVRKTHLRERFKIPLDWIVDIAIDIHPRVEQAILFCAVSPRGDKYLCNEIWGHGDGKWVAEEIVGCIKYCNYRVGTIIIDPLSKGDGNNDNTVFDKVQRILWSHGIPLKTASKDKNSGILEIKNHLKGPNNEPSLFIFNDLVRTIFEIEGYMYDKDTQKPMDKDDHMMENLYRLMLLDTQWTPIDHWADNDVEQTYSGRNVVGGY